MHKLKVKFPRS